MIISLFISMLTTPQNIIGSTTVLNPGRGVMETVQPILTPVRQPNLLSFLTSFSVFTIIVFFVILLLLLLTVRIKKPRK
ncbi:MAG: hypothetical protein NTV74_02740 [Euryarchaeota archaeon]|nr:hypothetical protein [Euryarchaeota archaeon]